MYDSEARKSKKGIPFGPILIIVLGLIFLLNNFGVLPWEIWQKIWKFWPILLILFGIEVLLGRNSSFRVVTFLLALIFLVPILLILNPLTGNPLATETLSFEKPLGNLTKTEINLEIASNNLKVTGLDKNSDRVLVASVKYSKLLPKPELTEEKRFGEVKYTFKQPSTYLPFSDNLGNTVELKLSSLIQHNLYINSTTGVFNFDLENINLSQLEINSGASQISIKYNRNGTSKTFIKTTAAKISLKIPKELEAQVKLDSKIQNIKVDDSRFKKQNQNFLTAAFDAAVNKIQIEIVGSASSLEIN